MFLTNQPNLALTFFSHNLTTMEHFIVNVLMKDFSDVLSTCPGAAAVVKRIIALFCCGQQQFSGDFITFINLLTNEEQTPRTTAWVSSAAVALSQISVFTANPPPAAALTVTYGPTPAPAHARAWKPLPSPPVAQAPGAKRVRVSPPSPAAAVDDAPPAYVPEFSLPTPSKPFNSALQHHPSKKLTAAERGVVGMKLKVMAKADGMTLDKMLDFARKEGCADMRICPECLFVEVEKCNSGTRFRRSMCAPCYRTTLRKLKAKAAQEEERRATINVDNPGMAALLKAAESDIGTT